MNILDTRKRALSILMGGAAALSLLTACANADDVTPQIAVQTSLELAPEKSGYDGREAYLKPGAAVRLSHDYDGHSEVGSIETVQILLTDGYDGGTLTLDIIEGADLTFTAAPQHKFDMSTDEEFALTLQIGTPQAGMHYLNLFANVETLDGSNMQRSFSIVFNVGDTDLKSKVQTPADEGADKAKAAPGLIIMDAQETIKIK